ncbi:MAG: TetR/AcrR family transcriptional regulator [Acidimicrobiales bacterium]
MGPASRQEADDRNDGRRLRAARNREAVVIAVLDILRQQGGGPVPGAAEVAKRAGVSERTVFRHFADLDSLFLAASARQRPVLLKYLSPRPDAAELDKRISALVRLRSRMWEEVSSIRRVAMRLAVSHDVLAGEIGEANRAARTQLADVFAPELKKAGRARARLLDQLELIMSWSSWESLRSLQGCSPERARHIVSELATSVLVPFDNPSRPVRAGPGSRRAGLGGRVTAARRAAPGGRVASVRRAAPRGRKGR